MLLSARFLTDVASVNTFQYIPQVEMYTGDQQNVYLQLIDASLDTSDRQYNPPGRRYMPPAGATLRVVFQNVNDAKVVSRAGVQAYPTADPSIWYIPILSSDPLTGTVTMSAVLTEPTRTLGFSNPKGLILRIR